MNRIKLAVSLSVVALVLAFLCSDAWQALWSAPATRTPARATVPSASPRFMPVTPMIRESVSYYPELDVQVRLEGYRDYVDYIYRRHNGKNDAPDPVITASPMTDEPEQYVMKQLYTEPFPEIIQAANPTNRTYYQPPYRYDRYGPGWPPRNVPEPPTWALIAAGLVACLVIRHRRRK